MQNQLHKHGGGKAPDRKDTLSPDTYIKQQAMNEQKNQDKTFQSKEARKLDIVFREVGIMSNQLAMTLVNTRQKLQPFLDDGVVHKDRKKATKKNLDENSSKRQQDPRVIDKIRDFRERIHACIEEAKIYELESVLNELVLEMDDTPEYNEIYRALRLNIIHGQILLANFFKHKREQKDKQVNNAKKMFSNALMADAKDEAKRQALKMLPDMKAPTMRKGNINLRKLKQ